MKSKDVILFFSFEESYAPYFAVAMTSIRAHADPDRNYVVRCLYSGNVCEKTRRRITDEFCKDNFTVFFDDISDEIKDVSDKLHTRDYYEKSTYYRLFIPRLYPEYDKALYLDSDIVLLSDVAGLYDVDLGDDLVGAVPDESVQKVPEFMAYVENRIGVASHTEYFNAGILLMNCAALRESRFEEKFIRLISLVTFDVAQDQDYLNTICKGRVRFIGPEWNKMPIDPFLVKREDIKLIHYNLQFKPWKADGILYEDVFWKYSDECVFSAEIRAKKSRADSGLAEKSRRQTERLVAMCAIQAADDSENARIAGITTEVLNRNGKVGRQA